jgi:hypothetical protein
MHYVHQQGSGTAAFHECTNCHDLVAVTANIEGETYCALNSNCLTNPHGFSPAVEMTLFNQPVAQKLERWRQNWCYPVNIRTGAVG